MGWTVNPSVMTPALPGKSRGASATLGRRIPPAHWVTDGDLAPRLLKLEAGAYHSSPLDGCECNGVRFSTDW